MYMFFFRICQKTEIFIKQMEDSVHYRYAVLNIFHSQGTFFFWNRFYLKHIKYWNIVGNKLKCLQIWSHLINTNVHFSVLRDIQDETLLDWEKKVISS